METRLFWLLLSFALSVKAGLHSRKIDPTELKCLVCRTTIKELDEAIAQIDPAHKMDIGGYRIDAKGDLHQKQVTKAKSELHLSELASGICSTMDNYIRGSWKDDGKLTVIKLIENGQMNPKFSLIDIIQDDDLNKSLKYYCEEIIEEHEENIIKQYLSEDAQNIPEEICMEQAKYCKPDDFMEVEHVAVPGSDDFASQLAGLNVGEKESLPDIDDAESFEHEIEKEDVKTEL